LEGRPVGARAAGAVREEAETGEVGSLSQIRHPKPGNISLDDRLLRACLKEISASAF